MRKIFFILLLIACNNVLANEDKCTIVCYEKTPTCYVTVANKGCIDISYEKPKCTKNSCICVIKGCKKKTTINSEKTTTEITPDK